MGRYPGAVAAAGAGLGPRMMAGPGPGGGGAPVGGSGLSGKAPRPAMAGGEAPARGVYSEAAAAAAPGDGVRARRPVAPPPERLRPPAQ